MGGWGGGVGRGLNETKMNVGVFTGSVAVVISNPAYENAVYVSLSKDTTGKPYWVWCERDKLGRVQTNNPVHEAAATSRHENFLS